MHIPNRLCYVLLPVFVCIETKQSTHEVYTCTHVPYIDLIHARVSFSDCKLLIYVHKLGR